MTKLKHECARINNRETIFDYNSTDEELGRFGGRDCLEWIKSLQGDYYIDPDDADYHLGLLFSMRGDKNKASQYWKRMKEKSRLQLFWNDYQQ